MTEGNRAKLQYRSLVYLHARSTKRYESQCQYSLDNDMSNKIERTDIPEQKADSPDADQSFLQHD